MFQRNHIKVPKTQIRLSVRLISLGVEKQRANVYPLPFINNSISKWHSTGLKLVMLRVEQSKPSRAVDSRRVVLDPFRQVEGTFYYRLWIYVQGTLFGYSSYMQLDGTQINWDIWGDARKICFWCGSWSESVKVEVFSSTATWCRQIDIISGKSRNKFPRIWVLFVYYIIWILFV